ncbi:MAG: ATP-binding cassette domain-containing protein [Bacteroidetes bacterium]|nr:ATP-binding cassette domain-containing protein [Bacteroidota bacterium]MBX7047101.1 ATP-binding cassette domain-containing protein [Ignavibacteria bacterium]
MIEFQNVSYSYPNKQVFDNIDLKINAGEFVFLVGESGIGKSTLLKLIYLELFPTRGNVVVDNFNSARIEKKEIPFLRRKLGVVFQDFKILHDRNVFENAAMPLYIEGMKKEFIKRKVFDALSKVGLIDKVNEMPYDLSGGEQQRLAIARAIINDPVLLIADEPTGNLDPFVSMEIIKLINEINLFGTAVILSTHNFEIVRKMKDKRIVQIKEKKLYDVRLKS